MYNNRKYYMTNQYLICICCQHLEHIRDVKIKDKNQRVIKILPFEKENVSEDIVKHALLNT